MGPKLVPGIVSHACDYSQDTSILPVLRHGSQPDGRGKDDWATLRIMGRVERQRILRCGGTEEGHRVDADG